MATDQEEESSWGRGLAVPFRGLLLVTYAHGPDLTY